MRVTSGNLTICKLGLAVNRVYRTREGEKKEDTTFVDVDAFGPTAETIAKYVSKGSPIFIEGRLQLDSWESQTGEKRSKLKVICDNFQFLSSSRGGDSSQSPAQEDSAPYQTSPAAKPGNQSDHFDDQDVPF